jgi:hypothetical protein
MTPKQVAQVQQSFAMVVPVADETSALFDSRLFEIASHLQPLFRGDVIEQGRKPMATLAVVVNGLSRLDTILPGAVERFFRRDQCSPPGTRRGFRVLLRADPRCGKDPAEPVGFHDRAEISSMLGRQFIAVADCHNLLGGVMFKDESWKGLP